MGIFDAASLPSSPTSQQVTTGAINTWAQPYVNNLLTGAQNLTASSQPNALMQQSYSGAANLQLPGQFAQGAQAAGQGINQALGAGQNYANMATNPNAIGAYMNPYIQQSLAPQLALLNQQQNLQGQNIAAGAVGKGAFGGNRETLAQGLNAQNYALAQQNAIGQGYNQAFQNAQQAQQFGANLGLQGAQAGIQGANVLGQLGTQQNQANLGILGLQNQLGQQQYNLPYQNLQFMQSMLSGLPVASQTTQGWQSPANKLSQMAGLGTTAVGMAALAKQLGFNPFSGSGSSGDSITSAVSNSPDNSYQYSGSLTPDQIQQTNDALANAGYSTQFDMSANAKGGQIKQKKVGSDLADLRLHSLVG
jgi:hypothetical protein